MLTDYSTAVAGEKSVSIQWNLSWNTSPIAIKAWSLKTGGLWRQVPWHWNVRPARNMWSFKTGGVSWQWSFKTGFTVQRYFTQKEIKLTGLFFYVSESCQITIAELPLIEATRYALKWINMAGWIVSTINDKQGSLADIWTNTYNLLCK